MLSLRLSAWPSRSNAMGASSSIRVLWGFAPIKPNSHAARIYKSTVATVWMSKACTRIGTRRCRRRTRLEEWQRQSVFERFC